MSMVTIDLREGTFLPYKEFQFKNVVKSVKENRKDARVIN